ncbi:SDR family NAD(P)-dependent oxidoreductase, partial [Streptomyces sp. NPDC056121]
MKGPTLGGHGFDVVLISRNQNKLDALAGALAESGITAEGFAAGIADADQLTGALKVAAEQLGRIDVLEVSPHAGLSVAQPEAVTLDHLRPQADNLLSGAVTAVQAVLPAMLDAGSGTVLFATGGGAIHPYAMLADTNVAQAWQRNWALTLHNSLAVRGIYAAS